MYVPLDKATLAKTRHEKNTHLYFPTDSYQPAPDKTKAVGSGAYGSVWKIRLGRAPAVSKAFALKRIQLPSDFEDRRRVLREIKVLNFLRKYPHPNLVSGHDAWVKNIESEDHLYVVMDWMETDLFYVIDSPKQVLENDHVQFFMHQLLAGLAYFHSAGFVHGDIKPANLLVNLSCDLKIGDFGLAQAKTEGKTCSDCMGWYIQTRWYRAPELIKASAYGPAIDVWAAGAVMAELLLRRPLFHNKSARAIVVEAEKMSGYETEELANGGDFPDEGKEEKKGRLQNRITYLKALLPPSTDPAAIKLLARLLAPNPKYRITAVEALKDPYLAGFYRDTVKTEFKGVHPDFAAVEAVAKDDIKNLLELIIAETNFRQMQKEVPAPTPAGTPAPQLELVKAPPIPPTVSREEARKQIAAKQIDEALKALKARGSSAYPDAAPMSNFQTWAW